MLENLFRVSISSSQKSGSSEDGDEPDDPGIRDFHLINAIVQIDRSRRNQGSNGVEQKVTLLGDIG